MARKSTRKLWAEHLSRGATRGRASAPQASQAITRFNGRVLGIDPSLRGSGFAVLEYDPATRRPRLFETSTLKLKRGLSMADCLGAIGNQVEDYLNQHAITHVAVEQSIYVQNFQTAQILGAARGAAIAAAAMRGLPVFEYAPLRVKQAVVGAGRASKAQVARTILSLTGTDLELRHDESDAAAVALCHAYTWRG
ncbi:MAG: crossover junction endodeoxyribonuclease RuvC [Opitutales bacterium]